jgi:hypothetical protein
MSLNYWDWNGSQKTAAAYLKPDPEDKNVSPYQMAQFINEQVPGVNAIYRYAGDLSLLKQLLLGGFPVLIETGFQPPGEEWMGHYRLLVGYSDYDGGFYVFDSYLGDGSHGRPPDEGLLVPYDEINQYWQHFNRVYVVAYAPDREPHLADILGADWDAQANYQHSLEVAQREAQNDTDNPFAWFNLGTSFMLLGDYQNAAIAYDQARWIGLPWRMLWYQFGPFEVYLNTEPPRLDDVEALAQINRNNTAYVEETYYYWGMAYMLRGEYDQAAAKFREALQHNRNFTPAADALDQVLAMQ